MDASEIAQIARNFSVLVRIRGPDPKGLKMRGNSFYLHQSGMTTISASGLLLPASTLNQIPLVLEHIQKIHEFSGALVVTVASVVQPFLVAEQRNKLTQEFSPRLISDACIDVLIEGKDASSIHQEFNASPEWLSAKLLSLVDVPEASDALLSLIGGQSTWDASWSLSPFSTQTLVLDDFGEKVGNTVEPIKNIAMDGLNNPVILAKSATRIAFLGISITDNKNGSCINISQHQSRGDPIIVMGSPFGALSPMHFYNSISVGSLANCCYSGLNKCTLLVADIRCLPGMEGAPVFDRHACLAGILIKPLRQKGSNTEIQFAVSWNAIASIHYKSLQLESYNTQNGLIGRANYSNDLISSYESTDSRLHKNFIRRPVVCSHSVSSLEKAISSVVLISVGDGSWASGILLNRSGLILTNAHILEPWRFGRTCQVGSIEKTTSHTEHVTPIAQQEENSVEEETIIHFPPKMGNYFSCRREPLSSFGHQYSRRISVRLDFMEQKNWYSAQEVYVSKGPLDVALLQLDNAPAQLSTIIPQMTCLSKGSAVYVIGHGLLGPRSNVLSSVSSGVLSNVVEIPGPIHEYGSSTSEERKTNLPIMLQTTAAVHPGASGGAVINSNGHMVGLVTSNARHGGGTIIPHLNFSIPCAALEPVFMFSETQDAYFLKILDKPNDMLSSAWALLPSESKKQDPELENKNYSEGKGTRFAQFLAKKNAEISSLKKMRFPSKI